MKWHEGHPVIKFSSSLLVVLLGNWLPQFNVEMDENHLVTMTMTIMVYISYTTYSLKLDHCGLGVTDPVW